jgi:hypothetical protein
VNALSSEGAELTDREWPAERRCQTTSSLPPTPYKARRSGHTSLIPPVAVYRLAATAPLYARPEIVRGDSSAPRRGLAARRPSGCLVVRGHNTGARLSVRSLGMAAKEVRMPAVVSSPCPRSCPASGVQCPVRASGVRRGLSR